MCFFCRLTSDAGLPELARLFAAYKPNANKNEFDQLDDIINRMEHWAHRLYPKFKFEDFLERVNKLGHKKSVKVCRFLILIANVFIVEELLVSTSSQLW